MLKLENYKNVFAAVGLVGVLLIASPTVGWFVHLPGGEKFSELWILGPGHMAEDYPFNVNADREYMVYVGVGNHMGNSAYYAVCVKLRNMTDALPNSITGTPSPLEPLYEYRVFVEDGKTWEDALHFAFSNVTIQNGEAFVRAMSVNGVAFGVEKSTLWDSSSSGYYFQLFAELWIYSTEANGLRYHNRFVTLMLNMTSQ
jgi:hypothetical protein